MKIRKAEEKYKPDNVAESITLLTMGSETSDDEIQCKADAEVVVPKRSTSTHSSNPDEDISFLEHGKPDGIGFWGAVAHMIRATIGTGILLLPFEMKSMGYVTGTMLLIGVSIVYYHIIHILLYLDYRLRRHLKVQRLTLAVIADEIFTKSAVPVNKCRSGILFVIYFYYCLPTSKSISLVVIANNTKQMAKFFNVDVNVTLVITVLIVILTGFCMCRKILKILVPFSSTTNVFTFIIAIVIVVYSIVYRNAKATVRPFNGDASFLLRGLVIFVNAVLSTDIVLPLKNGMRQPQKLLGIFGGVNVTAAIIVSFYYGFALIPYLNFGDDVHENILTNIPVNGVLTFSISLIYSLALFVSYILSFYACFDVVWTSKLKAKLQHSRYKCFIEYSIRILFNAAAYLLAVAVPNLALISAIGGIIGILVDVTLLPLLQILLMYVVNERSNWILVKNILLIAMSLVLFFMGIVDCVNEIRKLYS